MNWMLVIILFSGRGEHTVAKIPYQTKFLCEQAEKQFAIINQTDKIPLGAFISCTRVHRYDLHEELNVD